MKLKNGSQVATRPARKPTVGSPGYFAESNETGAPSHPGQDWFNDVIDELTQAVAAAGVTYDPSKITNLKSAVEALRNASNLNAGTVPLARLPAGTSGGIDAAKLEGKNGDYYRNIANMTGNVPIERLPTKSTASDLTPNKVCVTGDYSGGVLTGISLLNSDANSTYLTNNTTSLTGARYRKGAGSASRIWQDRSQGLVIIQVAGSGAEGSLINWIDALTIDNAGNIIQLNSLEATIFGIGQSLVDVTANRAVNTTFINTTDRPIVVYIYPTNQNSVSRELLLDGEPINTLSSLASGDAPQTMVLIVPAGASYRFNTNGSFVYWKEMS